MSNVMYTLITAHQLVKNQIVVNLGTILYIENTRDGIYCRFDTGAVRHYSRDKTVIIEIAIADNKGSY